ncbi:MAG TPA: Abi family protein [Rhodanobacteraceae bacterium]|nr:Abi family protein [Rhodanobacteraceae bacterium]
MAIADQGHALLHLESIGYYRLSGYWYAFRERQDDVVRDEYKSGSTFRNIIDLYVFDQRLRALAFEALERIEIALRVDVSHTLGKLHKFAHIKPEFFDDDFGQKIRQNGLTRHHQWINNHARLVSRSKEKFVQHHRSRNGLPLAIWVACEIWDFGALSTLYSGMRVAEQGAIANRYGLASGRIFATWLRSLNYLRNVCAHYARLWNRNIIDQPSLPSTDVLPWVDRFEDCSHARARCFLLLCLCKHLMGVVNPGSTWPERMRDHLRTFPDLQHVGLSLSGMGTPADWEDVWGCVGTADTKNPSAI